MAEPFIGAGGWAYFQVPGIPSLRAYSKAFGFVEVNSTFYSLPSIADAERWRRTVPAGFRFSVRAHRSITHGSLFSPSGASAGALEQTLSVCRVLNADVLHFQAPPSFRMDEDAVHRLQGFFSTIKPGATRLALEVRGGKVPPSLARSMRDLNVIHCVDLLKGELPAYESDTLYTRIFGRGQHNLYQPDDDELMKINTVSSRYGRAYVAMHGARMYSDAARLTVFNKTGKFPLLTACTGLDSLEKVLKGDARFPATKSDLVKDQGWKLFDLSEDRRVRAEEYLRLLPEKTYRSLDEVMRDLLLLKGGGRGGGHA